MTDEQRDEIYSFLFPYFGTDFETPISQRRAYHHSLFFAQPRFATFALSVYKQIITKKFLTEKQYAYIKKFVKENHRDFLGINADSSISYNVYRFTGHPVPEKPHIMWPLGLTYMKCESCHKIVDRTEFKERYHCMCPNDKVNSTIVKKCSGRCMSTYAGTALLEDACNCSHCEGECDCKRCPGCEKYKQIIANGDEVCETCKVCGREWEWGT